MKTFLATLAVFVGIMSAKAQIVALGSSDFRFALKAFSIQPVETPNPILLTFFGWSISTGNFFEGQSLANLGVISSPVLASSYGGPSIREEYVSINPYIRGPNILEGGKAMSFVFGQTVEAIGLNLVHRTTAGVSVFPTGEVTIFAFDTAGVLIGSLSSVATTGSYTDPTTWEFMGFETADQSSSIKGITVFNTNAAASIDPSVLYKQFAPPVSSAVPEPSTYSLLGTAALALAVMERRRTKAKLTIPHDLGAPSTLFR